MQLLVLALFKGTSVTLLVICTTAMRRILPKDAPVQFAGNCFQY